MKRTFIYALKCPITGLIRYIGKSDNPKKRFPRHLSDARNGEVYHRAVWIRSVLAQNLKPVLEIIDEVDDGFNNGLPLEAAYIQFFRDEGCDLTNATPGGEAGPSLPGALNPNFGKKDSPERLKEKSERMTGEKSPNWGRTGIKHPMFGKTGALHPMFGHQHTPDAIEKIKAKRATQVLTEERNAKISLTRFCQKRADNKSGFVGVEWHKGAKKWMARFKIFKKDFYLGVFSKLEDAVFVRALAVANHQNSL